MIRLRPLDREDLKQLRDWRNDPEIFRRVREYRLLNIENQEAWFNSLRDDRQTIMFGIEARGLIGVCGLTNIDWAVRRAEVSIYIGEESQRRGGHGLETLNVLARYAFNECNLERLWAEVFDNNRISKKLFLKAGYIEEGKLRRHAYKGGEYLDSYIYGLLRNEWQKKNAPSG